MSKKLLIATKNPGKIGEISEFLKDLPVELLSLKDVGIEDDVEEDGKTYEENSLKKALFYAQKSGLPAIADDGGLEIAALNNQPGVHSRRWLGFEAPDDVLIEHMKKVASEIPDDNRNAKFVVVETLAFPDGRYFQVRNHIEGIVAKEPHDSIKFVKGYPYRSFFYLPDIQKYYHESELSSDEQKLYNHRYKAFQDLKPIIKRELGLEK